jgi:transposase
MSCNDEFLAHYHQRSNVESTFSMVKRKFGSSVRAKTFSAQVNEVLLKCLCHNLAVLVHAIHELGVDPAFWSRLEAA